MDESDPQPILWMTRRITRTVGVDDGKPSLKSLLSILPPETRVIGQAAKIRMMKYSLMLHEDKERPRMGLNGVLVSLYNTKIKNGFVAYPCK